MISIFDHLLHILIWLMVESLDYVFEIRKLLQIKSKVQARDRVVGTLLAQEPL